MKSPHREAWLETLRTQYMVAVRNDENVSGQTAVMELAGFTSDELAELRVRANIDNVEYIPTNEELQDLKVEDEPADIDDCALVTKPRRKTQRLRIPKMKRGE